MIVIYRCTFRVCRKPKSTSTKSTRPNVNSIEENTSEQSVNAIPNTNYNPQCGSNYDSSDDNEVASIASTTVQIDPQQAILRTGKTKKKTPHQLRERVQHSKRITRH